MEEDCLYSTLEPEIGTPSAVLNPDNEESTPQNLTFSLVEDALTSEVSLAQSTRWKFGEGTGDYGLLARLNHVDVKEFF